MIHNWAYYAGMIVGFIVGIAIVYIAARIVRSRTGRPCEFDERQLLARGKAYKVGFFTMMFYMITISFAQMMVTKCQFLTFSGVWIGICLSITVFAINCIVNDAYMSLAERPKQVIILFSLIAVLNLFIGVKNIMEEPLLVKNELNTNLINMTVGVMFTIILFTFIGKMIYEYKHADDEEE